LLADRVTSSLGSIQTSDRRGAGGKVQSLFLDIRIKEWRQSSAKPWNRNTFNGAFEVVMPSTAEIRVRHPRAL
jgi:hypothetical protein